MKHTFKSKVWVWSSEKALWHFVTLPKDLGSELEAETIGPRRGFGSIKVKVKVGASEWKTSIFPDKKRGYLLPLKKAVRAKESIGKGDSVMVEIMVLD